MANPPDPYSSAARPWRIVLRLVAGLLIVAVFVWWAINGAHIGWTMTQVPSTQVDEVTQLEYIAYEERFVPGLELLLAGVAIGTAIIAFTFFVRPGPRRPSSRSSSV